MNFILKTPTNVRSRHGHGRNMRTQAEQAQEGTITPQMRNVARKEGMDPEALRERIAAGSVVIMQRGKRYTGIGKGLSTKVNVNLGTSSTKVCLDDEIQKAIIAEDIRSRYHQRSLDGRGYQRHTKRDLFPHHTSHHHRSRLPDSSRERPETDDR